ncbi:MAG: cation:proton antiporter [Elusimicrobiota bacterium]
MTSLLLLLVVSRVCGELAQRWGQPAVVGELLSGILLGPAALNLLSVSPELKGISMLGVFLLLLLAGMETRIEDLLDAVRGRGVWVAVMGFFIPLLLGIVVGTVFRMDHLKTAFLGLCLAITALPVSVRILMDLGKLQTDIGQRIIGTAVADDMAALLLLGVLFSLSGKPASWASMSGPMALALLRTLLFMGLVVGTHRLLWYSTGVVPTSRKLLDTLIANLKGKETLFAAAVLFVLVFASVSEAVGFHFVVGTFFGSMLLGREILGPENYREVHKTASGITMGFLAPVFFATLGLQLELPSLGDLPLLAAVLACAFLGKMLGGFWGGRLAGLASPESWTLGYGINARGFMALVAADIALSAGFIGPDLFSVLVLMGIVTTMAAPPLLKHAFSKLES